MPQIVNDEILHAQMQDQITLSQYLALFQVHLKGSLQINLNNPHQRKPAFMIHMNGCCSLPVHASNTCNKQ